MEQLYRDNRLNAIHEGTNGIQAIDLLGRKVAMSDGAVFQALLDGIAETVARAREAGGQRAAFGEALDNAVTRLATVTRRLLEERDPEVRLANAALYLEATGHIVVAWLWLDQLNAVPKTPREFYDGKHQTARFFYAYELPRVHAQLEILEALDRTALDMHENWF